VEFRSFRDLWAETTTPRGRLRLLVLAGLAEFERELIRVRSGKDALALPPAVLAPLHNEAPGDASAWSAPARPSAEQRRAIRRG